MSTATANSETQGIDPQAGEYALGDTDDYRAIHTGAVIGVLVALVSIIFPMTVANFTDVRQAALLAVAPLTGLVICVWALKQIRANRELYTGAPAAMVGAVVAAMSLLAGSAYGSYVYATEVPDGYQRTSFLQMKPDDVELAGLQLVPPDIEELLGKKVFIKGYIRPDSTNLRKGITEFLLVRDNNECCFGDKSNVMYFDQVMVDLGPGLTTELEERVFRVGGELSVRMGNPRQGEPTLVYSLDADYLK